ncbi:hypothetical protein K3369_20120 [Pseudomonas mandelii]|uniref:hypothetical protein n=1 Tax=Pseudomonas mandelii TaxID=75612 RepID=UPI001C83D490|nr:hypothetical protein [Pseudomonas mandelii]QZA96064.1 hypothetical protein K3369_20120 [Pseudomonas mandelii]
MINRVMANEPDLLKKLLNAMQHHPKSPEGLIDIERVKDYVSTPRLADFHVRGPRGVVMEKGYFEKTEQADPEVRTHNGVDLIQVGDSFLNERTMLADGTQKTYAISIQQVEEFKQCRDLVLEDEKFDHDFADVNVAQIQIWPFDPAQLSEEQLVLAVAISYSPRDWLVNERVAGAVDALIRPLGFYVNWDNIKF